MCAMAQLTIPIMQWPQVNMVMLDIMYRPCQSINITVNYGFTILLYIYIYLYCYLYIAKMY